MVIVRNGIIMIKVIVYVLSWLMMFGVILVFSMIFNIGNIKGCSWSGGINGMLSIDLIVVVIIGFNIYGRGKFIKNVI